MALNQAKQIYLGTSLTDDQLEDIPNPRAELHFHVLTKGVQVRKTHLMLWHRGFNYFCLNSPCRCLASLARACSGRWSGTSGEAGPAPQPSGESPR